MKATTAILLLGLFLLISTATVTATSTFANVEEHAIPTISLEDLRRLSSSSHPKNSVMEDFRTALSTNGLLAVRLDEDDETQDYSHDRKTALDGLCSCVDHPDFLQMEQTHALTLMESSTERTSVATATVGLENPLPLPKGMEATCGPEVLESMDALRDVAASVSKAFVSALDQSLSQRDTEDTAASSYENHTTNYHHRTKTTLLRDEFGKSYESVADIVQAANHLEHFHVYTNRQETTATATATAWDWHTDAGLFLVFVPAWDCHGDEHELNNVDSSFYYRTTEGTPMRAKFDGGRTAIVMLGQGAQDWLDLTPQESASTSASRLKPTTHSVRWSEEEFLGENHPHMQRRAWYGMMNLVPETALIYGGKSLREVKKSLSLSHQHKEDYQLHASEESPFVGGASLGCGSLAAPPHGVEGIVYEELETPRTTSRRRRQLLMQDASMCNNVTNFFCWMTCMEIPKADQAQDFVESGYSLYCLDESVWRSSGSLSTAQEACVDVHNMGCQGHWEQTVLGVPSATVDIATIESGVEIVEDFCYSGTTMYMEGFQWIQSSTCVIVLFESWVLNTPWKYGLAVIGTILLAIFLEKFIQQRRKCMAYMEEGTHRLLASAAFYGVQLSIGYVLMLIIMIYSGVLFLSVILGLVTGHVLFNARDAVWPIHESSSLSTDKGASEEEEEEEKDQKGNETQTSSRSSRRGSNLSEVGEERALREGSTHCQDFEPDNEGNEYYGSMEFGGDEVPKKEKRKTIDQEVGEGSTPCCQQGAC